MIMHKNNTIKSYITKSREMCSSAVPYRLTHEKLATSDMRFISWLKRFRALVEYPVYAFITGKVMLDDCVYNIEGYIAVKLTEYDDVVWEDWQHTEIKSTCVGIYRVKVLAHQTKFFIGR